MLRKEVCNEFHHPDDLHNIFSGDEIVANAEGRFAFPENYTGPYAVLPEEALQSVPSDDEEDDEGCDHHLHHDGHSHDEQRQHHGGHSHTHDAAIDEAKQMALLERRKAMEAGRKKLIKELYIPRHPHLYNLNPEVRNPNSIVCLRKLLRIDALFIACIRSVFY